MIGKFSAFIGGSLFVIFLISITHSVLKSPIITLTASIPVVLVVVVAIGMVLFDFKRMLFSNKKK